MPMSLVLMRPAVPALCLTPHYKDGSVAQAWPTFWPQWLVHLVDRRLKVVSLESFNEIKCADSVNESSLVFSWILSWKSVSLELPAVTFHFFCSTHQKEFLEIKRNEINTKKEAEMVSWEMVLLMYIKSLDPPLSILLSNSPFLLKLL